jgi:excisionase family DNA binding protein
MATTRTWLTVAEVADVFGVSVSTVHNMIKDGRILAIRPSGAPRGQYRIPGSEVVRHQLETGQLPTPAAA